MYKVAYHGMIIKMQMCLTFITNLNEVFDKKMQNYHILSVLFILEIK